MSPFLESTELCSNRRRSASESFLSSGVTMGNSSSKRSGHNGVVVFRLHFELEGGARLFAFHFELHASTRVGGADQAAELGPFDALQPDDVSLQLSSQAGSYSSSRTNIQRARAGTSGRDRLASQNSTRSLTCKRCSPPTLHVTQQGNQSARAARVQEWRRGHILSYWLARRSEPAKVTVPSPVRYNLEATVARAVA